MLLQNFSCLFLAPVVPCDTLLQFYDAPRAVEKSADGEIWTRNLLLLRRCIYRGATRSYFSERGSEVHIEGTVYTQAALWVLRSSIVLKMYPSASSSTYLSTQYLSIYLIYTMSTMLKYSAQNGSKCILKYLLEYTILKHILDQHYEHTTIVPLMHLRYSQKSSSTL